MRTLKNQAAISAIVAADIRGDSNAVMKPLYIERNTYDVGLDQPVYRIFQRTHFFDDIKNGRLTHVRANRHNWGDPTESPLLDKEFDDVATGGKFTLNALVENTFGSSWSLTPLDDVVNWADFSHGQPSLRIESTPRNLLTRVMNDKNPHYSVQHAIGKVEYLSEEAFEAYFCDPDFQAHLDPLGQGLHAALLKLKTNHQAEDEVRLLCDFVQNDPWVRKQILCEGELLRVPFNWTGAIQSVVVGPFVGPGGRQAIEQELHQFAILCPVTSSEARSHSG